MDPHLIPIKVYSALRINLYFKVCFQSHVAVELNETTE